MGVASQHKDYIYYSDMRRLMRDCIAGEKAVKDITVRKSYLPGFDDDPDDKQYDKFITRAIYSNYTGRTINRTIGAIFRKESTIELPSVLDYMREDCTGQGQSLEQFGKEVMREVLSVGRLGVLTEYPKKTEEIDDAEKIRIKDLKARFKLYTDENFYNYRSVYVSGKEVLTQVRLIEYVEIITDEFTSKTEKRYRVLDLDESGYYRQRLYDQSEKQISEDIYPLDSKGKKWDYIPFQIIGADDNTTKRSAMPFYDLAVINLGHYRNSASYEDGLNIHGQGTLSIDPGETTAEQFEKQNGKIIKLGARRAIVLGKGGKSSLLQMEANAPALEGMEKKQEQMGAFGVSIFEAGGKQQTAEEARIKASAESSVLSIVVGNASEGIEASLEHACKFMGADPSQVEFSLNREFFPETLTNEEAAMLQMLRDAGDIATADLRARLRQTNTIDPSRTDEEIEAEATPKNEEVNNNVPI